MENKSGIIPMEYKVLIVPKKIAKKTEGGIYMPDDTQEKHQFGVTEGVIVAVGPIAFTDPDWLDCPKPGDTILYDKYAGNNTSITGKDGEKYKLINDKEIGAILR